MSDEPMTLIEKLRNPAWDMPSVPGGESVLNVKLTCRTMNEAANLIEELTGMGVARNQPGTFNELKNKTTNG